MSTLNLHRLAHRLIAALPQIIPSPQGSYDESARACDRLRLPLIQLTGVAGFASLLSRALSLAKRQTPFFDGYIVQSDGKLDRLKTNVVPHEDSDAAREAAVLLIVELLSLLIAFVGEKLTFRLLSDAWSGTNVESLVQSTEESS